MSNLSSKTSIKIQIKSLKIALFKKPKRNALRCFFLGWELTSKCSVCIILRNKPNNTYLLVNPVVAFSPILLSKATNVCHINKHNIKQELSYKHASMHCLLVRETSWFRAGRHDNATNCLFTDWLRYAILVAEEARREW